jgi:hypothetical protein
MGVANLPNIVLPACVTEVVIFADQAKEGSKEACDGEAHIARAKAAWEAAGVTVRVVLAPKPHKDANDALRGDGPEAVRAIVDGTNEIAHGEHGEAADRREACAGNAENDAESFGKENSADRRAALAVAVGELAALAPVEFALMKGERAKELGVSKVDLTRLVNAERKVREKKERARRVAGGLDWPVTKDSGEPHKRSQENIQFFFDQAAIALSFDLMTNAVRINRGGETLELTDPVAKQIWLEADELGLHADEGYFMAVLENTARLNSFHPLRDYLDGLEWDGVPRLDTWLTDYMGAEDIELHRAFGRKHLIGAVRRVQKPGSKYDTILIFQGIQGQGKSSFIRALSPRDEYFSDAMKIGADIQEIMEVCAGKWLIEIPELDGMGRKDAASVKAMLSRQTDEARMAYGRYKTRIPRQFVMFGSVNDTHFLQDTTGNRRFWLVTVKPTEVAEAIVARLIANRDQIWAEAAHYERQNESVVLPKHLWEAAGEAQQARMVIDPWTERLEAYLTAHPGFVRTEDIYDTLGVSGEKQNIVSHKRVSGVLSGLGYERVQRRVNGVRTWGYANCDDAHCPE